MWLTIKYSCVVRFDTRYTPLVKKYTRCLLKKFNIASPICNQIPLAQYIRLWYYCQMLLQIFDIHGKLELSVVYVKNIVGGNFVYIRIADRTKYSEKRFMRTSVLNLTNTFAQIKKVYI
jgi:hypothetical protein